MTGGEKTLSFEMVEKKRSGRWREGGKAVRCEVGAAARAGVVQGLPGRGEGDCYSKGRGKPQ